MRFNAQFCSFLTWYFTLWNHKIRSSCSCIKFIIIFGSSLELRSIWFLYLISLFLYLLMYFFKVISIFRSKPFDFMFIQRRKCFRKLCSVTQIFRRLVETSTHFVEIVCVSNIVFTMFGEFVLLQTSTIQVNVCSFVRNVWIVNN